MKNKKSRRKAAKKTIKIIKRVLNETTSFQEVLKSVLK